ncbi:hypothetical protein OESDEN_08746 [Oesophagostomum dentatum]|uniref:Membrane protein BRI3 n=1 Tax=Oesophagostomum dentatum TaxID=61180 RepID=A0A0B1T5G8_OESDE|nr:hypothetical protein OESDEN_08746 [Oesophagostomum dentatum]
MPNEKSAEVPATITSSSEMPSAPPVVREEVQAASDPTTPAPTTTNAQVHQGQNMSSGAQNASPYSEPPPSYQMAVSYPTTPYPTPNMPHTPMPSVPPAYLPKPPSAYPAPPNQPPMYYATQGIGVAQFPQGERIPVTTAQVVVTVGNGFTCPHCNVGVVTKETDMCCMLCLILLTIFTFPFGLVFLCCLPCTVSRRCSNCRRTV